MKEVYCDTCYYCIKSKSKFKCILPNHIKLKISTSECIKEPNITTCSAHKSRNLKMKNEYFMNQLSIFDLIPEEENKEADICESCRYNENGCCSYDEPLGRYCVEGDAYELKVPEKGKPTVEGSDFSEIVEYVEERTGVHFVEDNFMGKRNNSYTCKASKHLTLMLGLSRFYPEVHNGALFISAGFVFQSKQIPFTGSSGPFEDVDKVVEFFNKTKEKYIEKHK